MAGTVTPLLILILATAVPAYATDYIVGDSQGWTTGVDYDTWVSDKTFVVGDSLLFQYSSLHSVDEVGASDYSACSSSNSIQSFSDQNTTISLAKAGTYYFVCGTPGHCANGMKLGVNVSAAGSTGTAPSTSPPSSSSTPSPPATTPSPPAMTPPESTPSTPSTSPSTPTTQPSAGTPTSKSTPTTTTTTSGARGSGFREEHLLLFAGLLLGLGLMG